MLETHQKNRGIKEKKKSRVGKVSSKGWLYTRLKILDHATIIAVGVSVRQEMRGRLMPPWKFVFIRNVDVSVDISYGFFPPNSTIRFSLYPHMVDKTS